MIVSLLFALLLGLAGMAYSFEISQVQQQVCACHSYNESLRVPLRLRYPPSAPSTASSALRGVASPDAANGSVHFITRFTMRIRGRPRRSSGLRAKQLLGSAQPRA